ncbi:Retrovirus-related Pol polyprotein from type-1 retrotransposable element R2 [Chionoecetes opilio]|uniref:Retrovirus-related Pol polyprotein from type-1 retrotransposable element R2 n=1 Tax=Chionoecetes opilio TaxID=41210 RepID=A0A8J4XX00_CHIOP|nr:Retrovirus-related Pol polyprotein from type-1 retrotransposable element R2 [Chionoecetes opilio]
MLAAYVDLKKAFDSAHRESLWDLLRLRGIPARTIGLMTGLYSGTESAVKCGAGVSSFFPVNTGVRQGCVLAPSLFNACMDWVLDKIVDQSDCGASLGNTKITDLVFADDAVIFAESLEVLVMALEALHEEAKPLDLRSPGSRPSSHKEDNKKMQKTTTYIMVLAMALTGTFASNIRGIEVPKVECPTDVSQLCPSEDGDTPVYLAHPEHCAWFCQCDNRVAYKLECLPGLVFDEMIHVCNWPYNAK